MGERAHGQLSFFFSGNTIFQTHHPHTDTKRHTTRERQAGLDLVAVSIFSIAAGVARRASRRTHGARAASLAEKEGTWLVRTRRRRARWGGGLAPTEQLGQRLQCVSSH